MIIPRIEEVMSPEHPSAPCKNNIDGLYKIRIGAGKEAEGV